MFFFISRKRRRTSPRSDDLLTGILTSRSTSLTMPRGSCSSRSLPSSTRSSPTARRRCSSESEHTCRLWSVASLAYFGRVGMFSAVVDKHFVDKIGDKTVILRKCRQRFCFINIKLYYFEKR